MKTLYRILKCVISLIKLRIKLFLPVSKINITIEKFKSDLSSKIEIQQESKVTIKSLDLKNSELIIKNSVVNIDYLKLVDTTLLIDNSEILMLGNSLVEGYNATISKSTFTSDGNFTLTKTFSPTAILVFSEAIVKFRNNVNLHCIIRVLRGILKIDNNVFINHDTDLRCEESITIGENVFISTNCTIYDTNTHSTNHLIRQREIELGFPNSTKQDEVVLSDISRKSILIGDNVWIGKMASVLKGSLIEDQSIVALGCIVTGNVPFNSIAYGNPYKTKINEK